MSEKRPNVIFIFPDQWRGDSLSYLGHPVAQTPFLDALAAEGTVFTSAYSNCPVCIPVRACLMTGKTPNGVGRFQYVEGVDFTQYEPTLVTRLRNSGYQTMVSGKTHFFPPRALLGFEQARLYDNQRLHPGFAGNCLDLLGGFQSDYDRWLRDKTHGLIEDTAQILSSNTQIAQPWTHDEALHANSWTVTEAIDMLERRDTARPFFLQVSFHRPHPPYDPPIEYFNRFADVELPEIPIGDWAEPDPATAWGIDPSTGRMDPRTLDRARRAYYAQLCHLDFQIGRLLRWLGLRRQMDNTVVIFSSDHGEQLGDHHVFRKSTAMEGSAKIPMIMKLPRSMKAPGGRKCPEPVALHDVMPTVLDLAGVEIPDDVEGRSFLPLARGESPAWRDCVHMEMSASPLGPWQSVTDGRWKYIWQTVSGEQWLFDLETDPQETRNLAGRPECREQLQRWRGRLVDQLAGREQDGLVEDGRLVCGKRVPAMREWVKRASAEAGW